MHLRTFKPSDVKAIDEIYRSHHIDDFGIPNLSHVLTQRVVVDDSGRIVAYGMVKLFAEAIMVLDVAAPQRQKIEAIKSLMEVAKVDSKLADLEQLHVFVKQSSLADILRKHFSFVDCSGDALVCRL